MTINEETKADNELPPYKRVLEGSMRMTGAMADEIITTLIDHSRDEECAEELGMSVSDWSAYVQQFEEQVRNKVRSIL